MVHGHIVLVKRPCGGRAVPDAEAVVNVFEIDGVGAYHGGVQVPRVHDHRAPHLSIARRRNAREAEWSLEPRMSAFMHAPGSSTGTTNIVVIFLDVANHGACATHHRAGPLEKSLVVNGDWVSGLALIQDICTCCAWCEPVQVVSQALVAHWTSNGDGRRGRCDGHSGRSEGDAAAEALASRPVGGHVGARGGVGRHSASDGGRSTVVDVSLVVLCG